VRRALAVAALLAGFALVLPSQAAATFHLMKIRQVYFGTLPTQDDAYVQLQMFAPGQNHVATKHLTVYGPTGTQTDDFEIPMDVPNAQSQRRILIGDSGVATPDFQDLGLGTAIDPSGGAVCFAGSIDCVAWGNFTGSLLSPVGTPADPPPSDTQVLERSIARGCSTMLENGDDTNGSAADFAPQPVPASPLTNSDTPPEKPCLVSKAPDTTITGGPKQKTTKQKAKFRFESDTAGATFECKLDKKLFEPCTSPKVYKRIKRGKHTFLVRATADGKTDPTPASYKWKRVRRR
jgi:hypothetical protein